MKNIRKPSTLKKLQAVLSVLPSFFSMLFICSIFLIFGGGLGSLMAWHGIDSASTIMSFLGGSLVITSLFTVCKILSFELSDLARDYKRELNF